MSALLKSQTYDSETLEDYASNWDFPMGLGEMAVNDTRNVEGGKFSLSAVPFQTGADALYDHAKYCAVSRESFSMPKDGWLQFSVDIKATTPGTQPGRVIHGHYTDTPDGARPYAQSTLEGQQAAVTFNMTSVETGQAFHWFVSGRSVFALIERLPSSVTSPKLPSRNSAYVGLGRAYTQIIKLAALEPGETHTYAIRYTRDATESSVEYFLDGAPFARVDRVGIPLDTEGTPFTGIYPSYDGAPGEELKERMDTFVMGHGLYSMLDAFPFQHPGAPHEAVSIPVTERLFGQGAQGEFGNFEVTTDSN